MNIHTGRVTSTTAGTCINLHRSPRNEPQYREYASRDDVEEDDVEEDVGTYDPELDSPSSWTIKSSLPDQSCWERLCFFPVLQTPQAAFYGQCCSNIVLVLAAFAGILYGILIMTGNVSYYYDDSKSGDDNKFLGGLIIFGSVVGGVVSLILINVCWWYRKKSILAQLGSTAIVIFIGAALIPNYYQNTTIIFILVFAWVLPMLTLVNLPMLFGGMALGKGEEGDDDKSLEIQPGDNLETASAMIIEEAQKRARTAEDAGNNKIFTAFPKLRG